ncbi:YceD family protein [Thermodesulfobium sp.]|jgi:uncharacterized protein|uniref:DUF177 domain-containing protein n=1 Tax=Thermodesulfobium narugense TaxID=184064 RepID=A0A7C5KHQ1_9BACT
MRIDVSQILDDVGSSIRIRTKEEAQFFEPSLEFCSPIDFDLTLTNVGKSILVQGKIKSTLVMECAICLNKFKQKIEFELNDEFVKGKPGEDQFAIHGKEIDLSELLRQEFLLWFPMKPVCVLCREDIKEVKISGSTKKASF